MDAEPTLEVERDVSVLACVRMVRTDSVSERSEGMGNARISLHMVSNTANDSRIITYIIALVHCIRSLGDSAASLSIPSLYIRWNGVSISMRPRSPGSTPGAPRWAFSLCRLAAIVPTSSRARACVGDGTLCTSVQFNRSRVTIPFAPVAVIQLNRSMWR